MAKREKQKRRTRDRDAEEAKKKAAEEEAEESRASDDEAGEDDESASAKPGADDEEQEEASSRDADDDDDEGAEVAASAEESSIDKGESAGDETALAKVADDAIEGGEEDEEELAAAQLGTDRYVLAGFFASGMLGAYVLGRTLQALWANASNKDWFNQSFPRLAGVADDDKTSYALVLAGVISLLVVIRTYRRKDVREWCDEVASELAKVVWPSRKDVQNYTFVVIAASAFATIYLTVLDRLWAFITNLVYGDGS